MRSAYQTSGRGRRAPAVLVLVALLLLGGCATRNAQYQRERFPDLPARAELVDTPFFPDDSHYCGPAALATSLTAAGLPVSPATLIGEIFLPGRQGSLQIEMLAGARRHGAVATLIPGTPEALLREIAAGHPVVVLQNLGLAWIPSWHYAVAIGYDLDAGHLLLRSGPLKRQEMSLRTFEYTWNRSQHWAFVTLPPGRLPVTASEPEVTRALVAFERSAPAKAAALAYRSALERWPDNPTLAMGLGNALYAAGDPQGAETVFRGVAERHDLPAAYNNRARVLLELGQRNEARQVAERGLAVAGPLRPALLETLEAIERAANH
ncbi:MAG: PA2778 family cysteine peptidase [Dechloromonas sp.]|nr:PA2778 family cysteine peptidase [Dechloromonas sp.]